MAHVKTVVVSLSGLAVAGAALLVSSAPAEAVTYVTGPVSYSMTGTDAANSTPANLVFAPFNVPGVPASNLTAVRIHSTSTGNFGGTATLVGLNTSGSTTFSFSGTPFFQFSNNQSLTGQTVAGTLTPNTTSAGPATVISALVSGVYPGVSFTTSAVPINTPTLQTYFTTGSPTINLYRIDYAATSGPVVGATGFSTATFNGQLYLSYEYTPGPGPDPVPAPTAIAGAAAAFAYTRRLKAQSKRIRTLRNSVKA